MVLIGRKELGRLIGVSEATIRRAVHSGVIAPDVLLRQAPGRVLVEGFNPARAREIRALI